ncbi:hypothetical protein ACOMHN_040992 [Nucella lapillus]
MSGMAVSANHSQTDGPVVGTEDGASELGDAGMAVGRPWDTSDPFFSAQTRELLKTVFKCYIQQVISWIGVLGNLTCCVVFWKQGLSDRINLLLFWLAVIDFINLASMLPFTLTCYSSDVILINNINVIVHTKINRIYVTCGYISGTLIVVMSVERCLHVVIPFKARRLLTYRSMVTAIFLAYLIPFIVYLPHLLGNTVEWRLDPSTNRSVAYMTPTTWFPLARYQTLLIKYLNLIGQPLCFVTVAVCCTVTIVHLRRTLVKRMEMTGKGGGTCFLWVAAWLWFVADTPQTSRRISEAERRHIVTSIGQKQQPGLALGAKRIGGTCFLWVAAWLWFVADTPQTSRRISEAERRHIVTSIGQKQQPTFRVPWRAITGSKAVWVCLTAHFCNNWMHYTLMTSLPTFMKEVLHYDIKQVTGPGMAMPLSEVLSGLLNRMSAVEGKVASLSDQIAALDNRMAEIDGGKNPESVPAEFRVENITQTHDPQTSSVTYTLTYQALDTPQILMAPNEGQSPTELTPHIGTVSFSISDTQMSPVLYIRTSSNLIYTLILIKASGPIPDQPETFPNIALTTTPQPFIKFQPNEEPEITITTHVTGSRQVRKETLVYYSYVLGDSMVDFVSFSRLYQDNLQPAYAESNDVNSAGNDGQNIPQRLSLLSHDRNEGETTDRVKLDTSYENSGVLFIEKRFVLSCRSCFLYEIRVTKPMPYFVDDGEYVLGKGALVAYNDIYNFGPDFEGARYFRFVRYNRSESGYSSQKTCRAGGQCELVCEAFGDYPTVYFHLFNTRLALQPAHFDQSGSPVSDGASERAKVKGWSIKFGYSGFSVIQFDDVRPEHAGTYECFVENIQLGMMLRRVYILTVVQ